MTHRACRVISPDNVTANISDFMGMMSTEDGGQDDAFNSWFNVNTAPQVARVSHI